MPKFSNTSLSRLHTCDQRLQAVAFAVVQNYDCTVVCGHRSEADQDIAFEDGVSKVRYPNSKHNKYPSQGLDLAPYIAGKGISWDADQCYYFAGYVIKTAESLGVKLRWGGDWDSDRDVNDQNFNDLVHFEVADA